MVVKFQNSRSNTNAVTIRTKPVTNIGQSCLKPEHVMIHFLPSGISLPSPQCVYWLLEYSCLKRYNRWQVI